MYTIHMRCFYLLVIFPSIVFAGRKIRRQKPSRNPSCHGPLIAIDFEKCIIPAE